MNSKIEASLYLGDNFIKIEQAPDGTNSLLVKSTGPGGEATFNANEQNAITAIVNTLTALSSGKVIDQYFNPTHDEADDELVVKCEWMRSGKLRLHGVATRSFNFCNTTTAALGKNRMFTCPKRVYRNLPERKQK